MILYCWEKLIKIFILQNFPLIGLIFTADNY